MEDVFNFELSPEQEADILADEYIAGYEAAQSDVNFDTAKYFITKLAELYTQKAELLSEFYRERITEIFETLAQENVKVN